MASLICSGGYLGEIKMSRQLDQIDTLELCEMMNSFHISSQGLSSVEEMRTKLREYFEGSCTRKNGEVSTDLV